MNQKQNNDWENFFIDRGLSEKLIPIYMSYINNLHEKNIPIIFEIEHLSNLMGINYLDLIKMIYAPSSFYREFDIPKRRGGFRTISSPYPSLLHCQKWIYDNILMQSKTHFCAHGFKKKHSIITNAERHLNQKSLLKIDIKNFFGSISINWVINYFNSLGYAENICFYLASICCNNDCLPQGAVTSPALSNILSYSLDTRLYKLSNKHNITYTRYADDLTFSGDYISKNFFNYANQIVNDFGFELNDSKTRHYKPECKSKKIITGLLINNDKLTVPKNFKRELRKTLYYIKEFGITSHIRKLKISAPNYLQSIEGKFNFWAQVEPDNTYVRDAIIFIRKIRETNI